MTDLVLIEGLKVRTVIGVNAWEREIQQTICLDLEMAWDIAQAGKTDDLAHTLDYFAVSQRLVQLIETSEFSLIEALIECCAKVVMDEFKVPWLRLKISKPLTYLGMDSASIVIERGMK